MKKPDVFNDQLEFDTASFHLRPVRLEDAKDLLLCYSDPQAVARMNADRCSSNFYFKNEEEMRQYISYWLVDCEQYNYIRYAILPKEGEYAGKAIGTIEIFGGEYGVLRIDLASRYETPEYIEEILKLTIDRLYSLFNVKRLTILAENVPDRVPVFKKFGFVTSDFRDGGYMEWQRKLHFNPSLDFAICGLACCLCTENVTCAGCMSGGCTDKDWCKAYHCFQEEKKEECAACDHYADCDFPISKKPKTQAIQQALKQFGPEKVKELLQRNEAQGINYHYLGEYNGDYDLVTAEEALDLILHGWE